MYRLLKVRLYRLANIRGGEVGEQIAGRDLESVRELEDGGEARHFLPAFEFGQEVDRESCVVRERLLSERAA